MSAHELVIRLGRPFDLQGDSGQFLAGVREIRVPFADRESAEAAQREITVSVRPVHDAGGEDYRPVVAGEVITKPAAIEQGPGWRAGPVYWLDDLTSELRHAVQFCRDCRHLDGLYYQLCGAHSEQRSRGWTPGEVIGQAAEIEGGALCRCRT